MSNENRGGKNLADAVKRAYEAGLDDYHLEPMVLAENGKPVGRIGDGDSVIFCCRRGERETELTEMFTDPSLTAVNRRMLKDLYFAILTMYHDKFRRLPIAFAPSHVEMPLAQVLSEAGRTQLHCSESEKFAHVTFFFNGGENRPFPGETDRCVPSLRGVSFDERPEMSLPRVADTVLEGLGEYDFIVANFANGDIVGHTRNTESKKKACACVSRYLEKVISAALGKGYVTAVTADHGNIEKLYNAKGRPDGSHSSNPVPFILIDPAVSGPIGLRDGALSDVAPTILNIMGIPQPPQMTGRSLAEKRDWGGGRKVLLIICDGWGLGTGDEADGIYISDTPYWDSLLENEAWSRLRASGESVGLGRGKAGNSEAGHANLGAGRCVMQDDVRLDAAVRDGSFNQNPVFLKAAEHAGKNGSALHLLAFLSRKSSHGSIDYPLSLCEMARERGMERVYLHIIFDGRSTEPGSAPDMLMELDRRLNEIGAGRIVDGVGRGIALDRDKNYAAVKRAYDAMVEGEGILYR